jgi:hypothetical protein
VDDNDTEPHLMTEDAPDPRMIRAHAERTELMRMAAQRIVDNHEHGRRMADEQTLIWARDFVRFNPRRGEPLGTGEPA